MYPLLVFTEISAVNFRIPNTILTILLTVYEQACTWKNEFLLQFCAPVHIKLLLPMVCIWVKNHKTFPKTQSNSHFGQYTVV